MSKEKPRDAAYLEGLVTAYEAALNVLSHQIKDDFATLALVHGMRQAELVAEGEPEMTSFAKGFVDGVNKVEAALQSN